MTVQNPKACGTGEGVAVCPQKPARVAEPRESADWKRRKKLEVEGDKTAKKSKKSKKKYG